MSIAHLLGDLRFGDPVLVDPVFVTPEWFLGSLPQWLTALAALGTLFAILTMLRRRRRNEEMALPKAVHGWTETLSDSPELTRIVVYNDGSTVVRDVVVLAAGSSRGDAQATVASRRLWADELVQVDLPATACATCEVQFTTVDNETFWLDLAENTHRRRSRIENAAALTSRALAAASATPEPAGRHLVVSPTSPVATPTSEQTSSATARDREPADEDRTETLPVVDADTAPNADPDSLPTADDDALPAPDPFPDAARHALPDTDPVPLPDTEPDALPDIEPDPLPDTGRHVLPDTEPDALPDTGRASATSATVDPVTSTDLRTAAMSESGHVHAGQDHAGRDHAGQDHTSRQELATAAPVQPQPAPVPYGNGYGISATPGTSESLVLQPVPDDVGRHSAGPATVTPAAARPARRAWTDDSASTDEADAGPRPRRAL
ncbi:hypothetical protein ACF3NT_06985 [Naumannella halotolerans]|uniref:hypothetical protein n=1 Tax=Naumannella halotolerans TaxID=993414 RepID=UPI00370D9D3F